MTITTKIKIATGANETDLTTALLTIMEDSTLEGFEILGCGYEATLKYWIMLKCLEQS